jgi:hypothetical protein
MKVKQLIIVFMLNKMREIGLRFQLINARRMRGGTLLINLPPINLQHTFPASLTSILFTAYRTQDFLFNSGCNNSLPFECNGNR